MMEDLKKNIWMASKEIDTIEKYLSPTDVMLEWGAGGSTLYFSKFVKGYYSIEHDKEYYNNIILSIPRNSNVDIRLVPNNSPRSYLTKREEFQDYILAVADFGKKFDKVLIDGRARQWCGIEVLNYIDNNSIVFVHDWVRERYHLLLLYYNIIEKIDSEFKDANGLAVLKKKI